MTVTYISDSNEAEVANWQAVSSKTAKDLMTDLRVTDVSVKIPHRYADIFGIYLNFLYTKTPEVVDYQENGSNWAVQYRKGQEKKLERIAGWNNILRSLNVTNIPELLLRCFGMETFLADDEFYTWLMERVYDIWDEFQPYIKQLDDVRFFYLHVPFPLIPDYYRNKPGFRQEWLTVDQSRKGNIVKVRTQGREYRYSNTIILYSNTGNLNKLSVMVTDESLVGREETRFYTWQWHENGDLKSYEGGAIHGLSVMSNRVGPLRQGYYRGGAEGRTTDFRGRSVIPDANLLQLTLEDLNISE